MRDNNNNNVQTFCGVPMDRAVELIEAFDDIYDDEAVQDLIKRRRAIQTVRRAAAAKDKAHKAYLKACEAYQKAVTFAASIKEEV